MSRINWFHRWKSLCAKNYYALYRVTPPVLDRYPSHARTYCRWRKTRTLSVKATPHWASISQSRQSVRSKGGSANHAKKTRAQSSLLYNLSPLPSLWTEKKNISPLVEALSLSLTHTSHLLLLRKPRIYTHPKLKFRRLLRESRESLRSTRRWRGGRREDHQRGRWGQFRRQGYIQERDHRGDQ